MGRRFTLVIALLASCLLAAPAAAGIKCYKDSKGVIRINNIGSAKPRQVQAEPPAVVPSTLEITQNNTGKPEPEPQPAPASQPNSPEQASIPVLPEISFSPLSPDPQLADLPPLIPEKQEKAEAPVTEPREKPLPLHQAAFDPETNETVSPPDNVGTAAPQMKVVVEGGIRRYRNRQGVLVITNIAPEPARPAVPGLQAKNLRGGQDFPANAPGRSGEVPGAPGLRPVSWRPELHPDVPYPAGVEVPKITAYTTGGPIRCYKDKHGVIHIENVGPGTAAPGPSRLITRAGAVKGKGPSAWRRVSPWKKRKVHLAMRPEARAGPEEKTRPVPASRSSPPGEVQPASARTPVPRVEVGKAQSAPVLMAAASREEEAPSPGSVRRYRDRQGVWHIESAYDHWILERPPLPGGATNTEQVLVAAVQAAQAARESSGFTEMARARNGPGLTGTALAGDPGGIAAFKDSRGHLTITNAPRVARKGRDPSWLVASARLDHIIQEAARVFQLPPTLIRAVIKVESNFVSTAVSPKGAMGLMQLMPETAAFLGVQQPYNPRENIYGGCRYLRYLIDSFGGSIPLALAAYNAGPQRVMNSGYRVPEIKETQEFLTQVLGWYFTAEKMARSPFT